MIIKAEKQQNGMYRMVGINEKGEKEIQEIEYKSKQSAYHDAYLLWPENSVWQGKKIKSGYKINID
jgi:hypothetical protein